MSKEMLKIFITICTHMQCAVAIESSFMFMCVCVRWFTCACVSVFVCVRVKIIKEKLVKINIY